MEIVVVILATIIVGGLIWLYIHWDTKRTMKHRAQIRQREEELRAEMMRSWNKNKEELRATMRPKVPVQPIVQPRPRHGIRPDKPLPRHDETHHHHFHQDTSSPLADVVGMTIIADVVGDIIEDRAERVAQEVFEPAGGSFGGGGASASWSEPVRESYTPSGRSDYDSGSSYDSGSDSGSSSSSSD